MSITGLSWGQRVTRKPHQCYDCYTMIPTGTKVEVFVGVADGCAYTLYYHSDCAKAGDFYRADGYLPDYWDGVPPLMDEINDSGCAEEERSRLRGHFPHVVCRLELHEQKAAIRRGETPE